MTHQPFVGYVTSSVLAFIISTSLIYLVRLFSYRFELLDHVSERKIHQQPTPRLGGVAVFVATFSVFFFSQPYLTDHMPLLWGCLASFSLGFYDDIKGMSSKSKLMFQILLSLLVCWAGFAIHEVRFLGLSFSLAFFSWPFTVLWFVSCMNAINLIDGLDSLCAGIVSVSAACLFVLSGNLLIAVFLSALIAFVVYNYPPASIFLGDGGSYFIGFLMAFYLVTVPSHNSGSLNLNFALLLMAVPFSDMLLAIVRRFLMGFPLFTADAGHIHHCLLRRGYSKKKVMFMLVAVQAMFSAAAYIAYVGKIWEASLAYAVSLVLFAAIAREVLYPVKASATSASH